MTAHRSNPRRNAQAAPKMKLREVEMMEAGTGRKIRIRANDIKNAEGVSASPEEYGLHAVVGGANRTNKYDRYYIDPNDRSHATKLELKTGKSLIVLHPVEEVDEAMHDTTITNLYKNRSWQLRTEMMLRGISGTIVNVACGFGTEAGAVRSDGRIETIVRHPDDVMADLQAGRPLDGGDQISATHEIGGMRDLHDLQRGDAAVSQKLFP